MEKLLPMENMDAIPTELQESPISRLIGYHNIGKKLDNYNYPLVLICTCMDYRIKLQIPNNFAFMIRTAGANMSSCKFDISYAIAVGGIRHIALIGHNDCGMANLSRKEELFIEGMVRNAGWDKTRALEYFRQKEQECTILKETDYIYNQAEELSREFPGVKVIPMLYRIEDNLLYLITR